jgi:hypothetical protein
MNQERMLNVNVNMEEHGHDARKMIYVMNAINTVVQNLVVARTIQAIIYAQNVDQVASCLKEGVITWENGRSGLDVL